MDMNQQELTAENEKLNITLSLAKKQLEQAKLSNEENKAAIIAAKKELRENTAHSVADLYSSDGFESLAAISQYVNPVNNKIADLETTANKIKSLEKTIRSPYFARINFKFQDEEDFEKIYIGRSSLMDSDTYEMSVYDWRSPIASVFYRYPASGPASYDSPNGTISGKVNLKRQYEIKNSNLEYFFDADIEIADEFLRKILSQNTSSQMKAIVETIQKEQDTVIRDLKTDLLMVQGSAGSGKTSVALHRAAYLMYRGLSAKLSANNIMIISPNSLFEQYIENVLPELGENNVESTVFEEIVQKILPQISIQRKNEFLELLLCAGDYKNIMKDSIKFKTSLEFVEIIDRYIEDFLHKWINFKDIYYDNTCIVSKEQLKEQILSGRKTTPLGIKLQQLEDYVLDIASEYGTKRLNKAGKSALKQELQKLTELNIPALYKNLFKNPAYFNKLAKNTTLPENIDTLLKYTNDNLTSAYFHYDDIPALTYLQLKIHGTDKYNTIKQVIIDEAQDYYTLHYKIFSLLFPSAKYTVLGDINQTMEKSEDLSLYEQLPLLLNKKKNALAVLDKSFRSTTEILSFSSKFIDSSVHIKGYSRHGDIPRIHAVPTQQSLIEKIISETDTALRLGYKSIGLICKTEKNTRLLFDSLKDKINVHLAGDFIAAGFGGITLMPVYMSKGLEFDAVLICDADKNNYHTEDDKKLLYIACTRALHKLTLLCVEETSLLI